MLVKGTTRVCGVMADPVAHSLSPVLHNYMAEQMGIDFIYVPFRVDVRRVEEVLKGAYEMNLLGMNATVPHKQAILPYLKEIDRGAADIGAVNTLVRMEGGYKGYNTDLPGIKRALADAGVTKFAGREAVVVGAGGAARAVVYLLAREGMSRIWLLNRTLARAEEMAGHVNGIFGEGLVVPLRTDCWRQIPAGKYLVIQATSVGMYPCVEEAPVEDPAFYRLIDVAMDIIYTPAKTKFMKYAMEAGAEAYNGLRMLLYQGVEAFELWTGQTVPAEVSEGAYCLMERMLEQS